MNNKSSGLLLEERKDGSISVGYVDYSVEFFGGKDYENFYELDKENADKLRSYFASVGYANLKEGLIDIVGSEFSDSKFCNLCKTVEVASKHVTW